jgi:hypothetical protein
MAEYTLADIKDREVTTTQIGQSESTNVYQGIVSNAISQYLSAGPGINEISTTYQYANGFHHIKLLNRASPEVILVYMSKLVGFHVKTQSVTDIKPIERAIKDTLIKGIL